MKKPTRSETDSGRQGRIRGSGGRRDVRSGGEGQGRIRGGGGEVGIVNGEMGDVRSDSGGYVKGGRGTLRETQSNTMLMSHAENELEMDGKGREVDMRKRRRSNRKR